MSRVFIGNLPRDVRERDLEDFFRKQGKIRDVVLKEGFGFVEFSDDRDADDAVHDLNGAKLMGDRVKVEHCHRDKRGGARGGGGFRGDRDGAFRGGRGGGNSRFGPPTQTGHRIIVENLSSRIMWQDLKDFFRGKGCDVTYAEAHKLRKNEGLMCFMSSRDLKKALDYDGEEMNGRKIKLVDDSRGKSRSKSVSRSRSRSPRRSRSHSKSKSGSRSRSRSKSHSKSPENDKKEKSSRNKSNSKSRSKSPEVEKKEKPPVSPTKSKSRSVSPNKNGDD